MNANNPNAQLIIDTVDDLVSNFLYYDRKDDEDLPRGVIEATVQMGDLSYDEIVEAFANALRQGCESAR